MKLLTPFSLAAGTTLNRVVYETVSAVSGANHDPSTSKILPSTGSGQSQHKAMHDFTATLCIATQAALPPKL